MKAYFRREFIKAYNLCPPKVRQQFKKRLNLFLQDQFHPLLGNHALQGEWKGFRSINITGDYRALYRYRDEDNAEFFIIDRHGNLYK